MEIAFPLAAMALVAMLITLVMYLVYQHRQRWQATLREVAARRGLLYREGSLFQKAAAEGQVDGMEVIVDSYTVSHGKSSSTYTRVRVFTPETGSLTLASEGFMSALGKAFVGDDIQIGDQAFDDLVVVRGDPADAVSRLNAPTRRAVGRAVHAGAALNDGEWSVRKNGLVTDADKLDALVGRVIEAARAARRVGTDVRGGLLRNAREEQSPELRARNLALLLERGGLSPEELAPFTEDPGAEVRLIAARALRSVPVLVDLLDAPAQRVEAALELARLDGDHHSRVQEVLLRAISDGPPDVRAIDALGAIGSVAAVEPLLPHTEAVVPGKVVRHARDAIAAIQSRQVHAEAGQISLADPQGGELSLAKEPQPTGERAEVARPRERE